MSMHAKLVIALAGMMVLTTGPALLASGQPVGHDDPSVAAQQAPPAGEPISLAPLTDLTSLEATATITVDGVADGEPTSGELTADLVNGPDGTQIVATGSLLGDIVAQIGGSAVSLFRPKQVSVYQVPEGSYAVVSGLFDVCVQPADPQTIAGLQELSPQSLLATLTSGDVARGTLVGEETIDGVPVAHYRIDGEAFLAAAQVSADPNVQQFAESITSASDADLYVSAEGYPVAYRGAFEGAFAPLSFEGALSVEIALTGVNGDASVELPEACDNPISL
jgi:hypothetical protein